jgi:formiminotetrahydrofolate cyclodeaminase
VTVASHEPDLPSVDAFVRAAGGSDGGVQGSSGAVAALGVALAADLAAQVARASSDWEERGGALAQADAIRERAIRLAGEVEQSYRLALRVLARSLQAERDTESGQLDLGETLGRVIEPLLGIAEAAADAAMLAELVARSGDVLVRANAVAATMLATAAAEMSAHLVEVNLLMTAGDDRVRRTRELVATAAACRENARSLGR